MPNRNYEGGKGNACSREGLGMQHKRNKRAHGFRIAMRCKHGEMKSAEGWGECRPAERQWRLKHLGMDGETVRPCRKKFVPPSQSKWQGRQQRGSGGPLAVSITGNAMPRGRETNARQPLQEGPRPRQKRRQSDALEGPPKPAQSEVERTKPTTWRP